MEESGVVVVKKIWSMLRALYFMLRKGKSKNMKLMLDLRMLIKRGKLSARNALHDHVFSCSNTNTPLVRVNKARNGVTSGYRFLFCAHALHTKDEEDVVRVNIAAVKAVEMFPSDVALPAVSGLRRSPVVRVTDSPYPVREVHDQDGSFVDEAAEEFIIKFYQDLKKQNLNL